MGFTRIDVHAHFLPDFYNDALVEAGQTHPDGMPATLLGMAPTEGFTRALHRQQYSGIRGPQAVNMAHAVRVLLLAR
jgi:hypothetical protein